MDKNLIVQIPKRYRKSMERRWNIDNFEYNGFDYASENLCVLCQVHYTIDCNNCPFVKFEKKGDLFTREVGCLRWLRFIKVITLNSTIKIGINAISIPDKSKIPTRQLKRLVDTASRYIEWV